jgi:hypothetical protein
MPQQFILSKKNQCDKKFDMSTGWKLTKKGGACKVKKAFCMYCACSSDRVKEPVCPCGTCYQYQHLEGMVTDENACYHYKVEIMGSWKLHINARNKS